MMTANNTKSTEVERLREKCRTLEKSVNADSQRLVDQQREIERLKDWFATFFGPDDIDVATDGTPVVDNYYHDWEPAPDWLVERIKKTAAHWRPTRWITGTTQPEPGKEE